MKRNDSALYLTPAQAAEIINVAPELIRVWLRNDKFDFGVYIKGEGKKQGSFKIFKKRFIEFAKDFVGTEEKDA